MKITDVFIGRRGAAIASQESGALTRAAVAILWLMLGAVSAPATSAPACDHAGGGNLKEVTGAVVFLDGGSIRVDGTTGTGAPVSFFLDRSLDRPAPALAITQSNVPLGNDDVLAAVACLREWSGRYKVEFGMPEAPSSDEQLMRHRNYWLVRELLDQAITDPSPEKR